MPAAAAAACGDRRDDARVATEAGVASHAGEARGSARQTPETGGAADEATETGGAARKAAEARGAAGAAAEARGATTGQAAEASRAGSRPGARAAAEEHLQQVLEFRQGGVGPRPGGPGTRRPRTCVAAEKAR